jgi:hypothetical protein
MNQNIPNVAITPSTAISKAKNSASASTFAAGAFIRPEYDRIGNYLEESGRQQLCIPEDWLATIQKAGLILTHEPWKVGRWVSCRLSPRDRYRVVKTNYGYRLQSRVSPRNYWHILGELMSEVPLLFPTLESAITTAEVIIQNKPDALWQLTWMWP